MIFKWAFIKKRYVLITILSVCVLIGFALGAILGSEQDKVESRSAENIKPEVESQIISLSKQINRNRIFLKKKENTLIISDGYNKMEASLDTHMKVYRLKNSRQNLTTRCTIPLPLGDVIDFDCTIENLSCVYSIKKQKDGSYRENRNTCKTLFNNLSNRKNPPVSNLSTSPLPDIGISCEDCEEPTICPKATKNEKGFFCEDACELNEVKVQDNRGNQADSGNLLNITTVYTADEHEGCFLWQCNGGFGNLHILLVPYNESLLKGSSQQEIFSKIKASEDGWLGVEASWFNIDDTPFGINKAPVAYHHFLRGPYLLPDGKQCEWYETEIVGPQRVFYDKKIVWDWDEFCACGECPISLIFAIWESDEGYFDDAVAYGVINYIDTLIGEVRFKTDDFEIVFETLNPKPFIPVDLEPDPDDVNCLEIKKKKESKKSATNTCGYEAFAPDVITPLGKAPFDYECWKDCKSNEEYAAMLAKCPKRGARDPNCAKRVKSRWEYCKKINFQNTCAIPSNIMIEIWEYACVKHLQKCEYKRAENQLDVLNFQCKKRRFRGLLPKQIKEGEQIFQKARDTKKKAISEGTSFVCDSKKFTLRDLDYTKCIK